MTMTREQAFEIQQTMQKLLTLFKATVDIKRQADIQTQKDRLDPFLDEAGAIVIRATDDDFAHIAAQIAAQTKPIDDAIADISKIAAAITTAAAIINALVAALGKL